jgi:tetratricopeptide (TPR) repeat protein
VRTFLIADIRGYTRYTLQHGDEAAARLSSRFAGLADEVVTAHTGSIVETRGDEVMAVFSSPRQGLLAGAELQERAALESEVIPAGVGLDSGEAVALGHGFRGAALNLAARLCAIAKPGETLASEGVIHLARRTPGLAFQDIGLVELKGFADPVKVVRVLRESPDRVNGELGAADDAATSAVTLDSESQPEAGFLGARPAGPLVARTKEIATLEGLIDAASSGQGALVSISGEPGVGKTRLSQSVTLAAGSRGFVVATGRCYEPQQAVPFYPFREIIATAFSGAPETVRAAAPTRWAYLTRLLPELPVPAPPPAATSHEEQQRLYAAVTGFILAVAEVAPVGLFLDDLHWADTSSIELLQHLARQTRGHRVLLQGTFRDTDVSREHALQRALVDLAREHLLTRIPLGPMTGSETADLVAAVLGGRPDREVVDFIFARTDGNPFFVEELAQELQQRGDLLEHDRVWTLREASGIEVPENIRLVIGQRLARLSVSTQAVLTEASVLGQSFSFDELLGVTRRGEDELDEALQEAEAAGLVKFLRDDRYIFNHALTQQALYFELSPRSRRRLHLAAGEVIEAQGEAAHARRAAEMAWHFAEAGDPRSFTYALLAGDHAEAIWAHDDARVQFTQALKQAESSGDGEQQALVRERLGGLGTATIRYREALESLELAASLYRGLGRPTAEARVVAQIGRVHVADRSLASGIRRLEGAIADIKEADPAATAGLHSSLGRLLLASARYEEAGEAAREALSLLESAGVESGVNAEAMITHGASLTMEGDWSGGESILVAAVTAADRYGDLFSACRGRQHLASVRLGQQRFQESAELLGHALRLAERMANPRQTANALFGSGLTSFLEGHDEDEAARRSLQVMLDLGGFWFAFLTYAGLSLWLSPERWEAMPSTLRRCVELSESLEVTQARERLWEAETRLAAGQSPDALRLIETLLADSAIGREQTWPADVLRARCLAAEGRAEDARQVVKRGLERSRTQNLSIRIWEWESVQA